jgi:hypothetical protein
MALLITRLAERRRRRQLRRIARLLVELDAVGMRSRSHVPRLTLTSR